jgi:hypothetical protein
MYTGENLPMKDKQSLGHKFEAALGTIFRISVFKEASRNF